jgi:Concanavalin A-like lectin/glucanases superfamily/Bacterial TSP3 repeat
VLKTTATVARNLANIPDLNNWLGRSNWTVDANLNGTLDEFRIYDRILTPHEILVSRIAGPDASQPDADADNLPDAYEVLFAFLNKNSAADAALDPDGDFTSNLREYQRGTNPSLNDSDGDGFSDGTENGTGIWVPTIFSGTNPLDTDSDDDGLSDVQENNTGVFVNVNATGTNPNIADTDGDGYSDGYEVSVAIPGTNPVQPNLGGMGYVSVPNYYSSGGPAISNGKGKIASAGGLRSAVD